ncbi:helix-turn-helix domain-containing protein [Rahnella variigena]|nr:helix-turn-helix domain-containing protein [Rahnella variigena]
MAVRLYDEKNTVSQICEVMGLAKSTLYKYIDAARNNFSS